MQQRTRYLNRKVDLPDVPPQALNMLVAQQKHGARWLVYSFIAITVVLPLAGAGAGIYFAVKQGSDAQSALATMSQTNGAASSAPQNSRSNGRYAGAENIIFYDVDGDGNQDVIGLMRYTSENDTYRI